MAQPGATYPHAGKKSLAASAMVCLVSLESDYPGRAEFGHYPHQAGVAVLNLQDFN